MRTVALVFAGLAALIHVYIFVLESLRFDQPSTWRVFGVRSEEDAQVMKPWAFNQGFYNLFLAIGAAIGIQRIAAHLSGGHVLLIFCLGCMLGAALVLIGSDSRKARAAVVQGAAPAIAIALLLLTR